MMRPVFAAIACLISAAVLGSVATGVSRFRNGNMIAYESAVIGSLKTIAAQEKIFQERVEVDQDGDWVGEYGHLCELCGEITPRNGSKPVSPACIPQSFATGGAMGKGVAEEYGYYFRIYLVGPNGQATDDRACDGTQTAPSTMLDRRTDCAATDAQEEHFFIYAWPVQVNGAGQRCFVINEVGEIYGTKMQAKTYSGMNGPSVEAGLSAKGGEAYGWFNDPLASGPDDPGNDGNIWSRAD